MTRPFLSVYVESLNVNRQKRSCHARRSTRQKLKGKWQVEV